MNPSQKPLSDTERARIQGELHRDVAMRRRGYRARALEILPHVCASCGREFSGKRLRELTVHHRDHDYHNNPPDGSNWELLCLYCHDHEHEKTITAKHMGQSRRQSSSASPSLANPFDALDGVIEDRE